MKKLFLLFTMTACVLSAQAQISNVWIDESLALPRSFEDATDKDMVAIAADNSVYIAGLFTEPFSFGTTDLEPVATSTYFAKYDATGNKKWAVAFAGASTPTAITVSADGSIYIAGTLADEVVFGSTDGVSVTKEGTKDGEGNFSTTQSAAFIAKYDAEGVLKQVKTYLPTALTSATESGLMYEPYIGLTISEIKNTESGLVASFLVQGEFTENLITLKGTYYNIFDFMVEDIPTGYIVGLKSDLSLSKILVSLGAPENEPFQYKVYGSVFTVKNNKLYVVFETAGSQTLTAGTSNAQFSFTNDGENFARGYVVASVDISAVPSIISSQKYENSPLDYYLMETAYLHLSALNIVKDDLVVAGYFGKDLPFNKSVVAADDADLYVAVLNPSDLSVKSTTASAQSGTEKATSTTIIGDSVLISSIIDKNSNLFVLNLADKSTTNTSVNGYLNGIAANGENLASIIVPVNGETAKLVTKLDKYSSGAGIEDNEGDNTNVHIYPNPVVDELFITESSNIDIYNGIGALVVSKKDVKSINVQSLIDGIYFAVITTQNGKQTIPFIKK